MNPYRQKKLQSWFVIKILKKQFSKIFGENLGGVGHKKLQP